MSTEGVKRLILQQRRAQAMKKLAGNPGMAALRVVIDEDVSDSLAEHAMTVAEKRASLCEWILSSYGRDWSKEDHAEIAANMRFHQQVISLKK